MNPVKVMGMDVYPYTGSDELINNALSQKKILLAVNAEILLRADEKVRHIYNSNIGYPDGVGAVMALHKLGFKNAVKIPGCELWLKVVAKTYTKSTFYLIGATEEVIIQTVSQLKSQYPGIRIVGYRNGYISESEYNDVVSDVVTRKPDVVFVAMGMPRQGLLMDDLSARHKATYLGLGGSFDVYTGNVKRAPKWWIDHKLEFAYRLFKQPSRIRRQIPLIKFFLLLKLGRI